MVFRRKKVVREEREDLTAIVSAALRQAEISAKREAAKTAARAMIDIALDMWDHVKKKIGNTDEAKFIFQVVWDDVANAASMVLFSELIKAKLKGEEEE